MRLFRQAAEIAPSPSRGARTAMRAGGGDLRRRIAEKTRP